MVASFPEGRQARRSGLHQPDEIEVLIIPVGSIGVFARFNQGPPRLF